MTKRKFEVYRDRKKEWRWRLVASNGKNTAVSGEGFQRRRDCLRNIDRLVETCQQKAFDIVTLS